MRTYRYNDWIYLLYIKELIEKTKNKYVPKTTIN
jgi:hypothetical protein